jgi:hypothetical protein
VAVETTKQIIQENPEIEAYRLGLLQSVQKFINENLAQMPPPPVTPPSFQVAGLTPMQQQAVQMAQQGIGAYQPYLEQGLGAMRAGEEATRTTGLGGLQEAFGATREGQSALSQAAALAAQTRAQPYAYQQAAEDALRSATGLGYDVSEVAREDFGTAARYGLQGAERGASSLFGTGEQFQPENIQSFMNPYEEQVVQQALRDIAREGDIREQGLQAQAAASGAFGGSRQAVAEQELARNVMEQQARTGAQMRMSGYQQAGQQAQTAFEQAKQRQQQQAQLYGSLGQAGAGTALSAAQASGQIGMQAAGMGQQAGQQLAQLGLGYGQLAQGDVSQLASLGQASGQLGQGLGSLAQTGGQLGGQLSQMGLQQASLGQLGQQLGLQDIKTVEAMGARDQALQQAILDARRQSNQQLYQMPYEQYSFLSDIYKGTPSSQQVTQISQQQDPSIFQQIAGLGIAGLSAAGGAKQMGMF